MKSNFSYSLFSDVTFFLFYLQQVLAKYDGKPNVSLNIFDIVSSGMIQLYKIL